MSSERLLKLCRSSICVGAALAVVLGTAVNAMAQALKDVKTPDTPLVLKAQGSFFVGGDKVDQTQGELGDLGPGGHITVNQMYVRYMVPQGSDGNVPVVMVHGATLTGKSWETTPDGRMGWDEYFVRRGYPGVRAGPGGPRAIGLQPGRLQQRARRLGACGQPSPVAAIQRRGSLAQLPHRPEARSAVSRHAVPGERAGRTVEAGCARRHLWRRRPQPQPYLQGIGRSRR